MKLLAPDPAPSPAPDPQQVSIGSSEDGEIVVIITEGPFGTVQAHYSATLAAEIHKMLGEVLRVAKAKRSGLVLPPGAGS